MTVFERLKKQNRLRSVRSKGPKVRIRKIEDPGLIPRFLKYWEPSKKFEWPGQPWYVGTGLHYSRSSNVIPIESQVCGNHENLAEYQDTMFFDQDVVPGLLDCFGPLPMVRCKITSILGDHPMKPFVSDHLGWHRDESPFECLRVIIPLSSDLTYMFQMENSHPICMMPGYAYAFDQSTYHRVFSNEPSNLERIHLVLSFVTWFSRTGDGWQPSPFFNKTHPLDLFDLVNL